MDAPAAELAPEVGTSPVTEKSAMSADGSLNHVDGEIKTNGTMNGPVENHSSSNHVDGAVTTPKSSSSSSKHHSSSHKSHSSSSSKHHSSSSKDKHHHSSSSSKHGSSSSGKEGHSSKHGSSSSSSKHGSSSSKHHSSSSGGSSSKHKDGSSSSGSHKHSSSSSSSHKHHSSSSSKDKNHSSSSSSSKDKHHSSSSSSSKPKEGSSHSSSKSKEGSGGSSSSSKHKEGSSSSSSKHKEGSSSSSSKPKEGSSSKHHSSSSSSADRHKHSHSSDKHKHDKAPKEKESDETKVNSSPPKVKQEASGGDVKVEPAVQVKLENTSPEKVKVRMEKPSPVKSKVEPEDSEDDTPLSKRIQEIPAKRPLDEESDEDDEPLNARLGKMKKVKKEEPASPIKSPKKRKQMEDDDEEDWSAPKKKKKLGKDAKKKGKKGKVKVEQASPTKKVKKEEGEQTKWKWWEEEKRDDGKKWHFLQHKGPYFAPPYEPLPSHVRFFYDGKPMKLSLETEEVATFYGRMIDHDYTTKDIFNKNFLKDWRSVMTPEERKIITDLSLCNFREIDAHFKELTEERKNRSKAEKQELKKQNEELINEYGFCMLDGHKEKIGNFKIEPPGLFRGRGEHPKQGMLKRRIMPRDIIINCSKDSVWPKAPEGYKWKEVRHDPNVTWLASWTENIQGQTKYIMLNPASKLKGEKDWQKYETARKLYSCVDRIRAQYREDWKSKEMRIRQRAVAMYFIDKLALRAGNEKDEDTADTVGCCSLRVEHIKLHEKYEDGQECVVEFDFLGKDSIRYYNRVSVEKRVFKNLQLFTDNKNGPDDLFDRLNTAILNKHLQGLMDGLTAKVFRTFNASRTLQEQLNNLTDPEDEAPAKLLSYNRANRAVAILCNHQRAVPKTFDKTMENMQNKIDAKRDQIKQAKKDLKAAKADYKALNTEKARKMVEQKKKSVERLEDQLKKLEIQKTDKDENKEIALGTSKLNYLDPRISVAWCKKWEVPIEKVYNKTQRDKFAWAIDMAEADFTF